MVYECLKCRESITESEEHDSGFKQTHGGDKGSPSLVLLSDVDIVVSPANVEFGKQGGLFHVINEFRDKGERVGILDYVCYASRQTYVEVNDTYSEGGTHEETLRPQSKAKVMNKR